MIRRAPMLLIAVALIAIVASLATPAAAQDVDPPDPGPVPGAIGEPVAPLADKRVYDVANLLNNAQEAAIETDAGRLARHGIPNVTVILLDAMPPEELERFASAIRQEWGVESTPGADDGLAILITVSNTEEGRGVTTTLSWGDRALPHFGVTETTATDIQQTWLDRYIDEGYLFEGVLFTLRRLIYHTIYDPAPQEPITGIRATLGTVMSVAGVALAAGAIALAGWRSTRGWRRRDGGDPVALTLAWGAPALAATVFALSVAGQSGLGIMAALALLGVAAASWIALDPRQPTQPRGTP